MRELNQKMTTGMQQMQQALISTRKEKNEIIAKSEQEKVWLFVMSSESWLLSHNWPNLKKLIDMTKGMKEENGRLQNLVMALQEQLDQRSVPEKVVETAKPETEKPAEPEPTNDRPAAEPTNQEPPKQANKSNKKAKKKNNKKK